MLRGMTLAIGGTFLIVELGLLTTLALLTVVVGLLPTTSDEWDAAPQPDDSPGDDDDSGDLACPIGVDFAPPRASAAPTPLRANARVRTLH